MECIAVVNARYISEYRIWVEFNNGDSGEVDLKPMVFKYAVAAPLRETANFEQFHLDGWPTLAWNCGFDVSPEYLYELATGSTVSEVAPA
jgi:hypothetical protein